MKLSDLEKILALTPGNVYWKDQDGKYLGCNNNQLAVARKTSINEVIGKTDYDLYSYEVADKVRRIDEEVMQSEMQITFEENGVNPAGESAIYLSSKIPLFSEDDKVCGILGISVDITDRKHAEEREKQALAEAAEAKAKEAMAERDLRQAVMVLTGSIVHDLRTPIAVIELNGEFICQYLPVLTDAYLKAKAQNLVIENDDPELKYKLNNLIQVGQNFKETARSMHEFINVTLKTLSKVLRGELTQEDLVLCKMWHCIHNTIERYPFADGESKLVHNKARHIFDFMGNEVLMIRVLSNLLKNSLEQIKKQGKGEIFITTEADENLNILRFKDTAGGAPSEVVEHLFDGYHTTKAQGTGVGLAFCKLTMKSFGGDITCNSVYGDYIEFVLSFPKLTAAPT